tara:strand:+ start:150 stop:500 length:351 start_codon:yes stop_codon:yes gene_type:complete
MINLKVDEGYAFDFISILEVKNNLIKDDATLKNLNECSKHIKEQLGNKFNEIIISREYKELLSINEKSFKTIDLLRSGEEIKAKDIDDLNTSRFNAKKNIQKKFFKNNLTERKSIQ